MLDTAARQRDFPSLQGRAYLNTAAEGVPPVSVGEALAEYFRDKQAGMDGREAHFARWEAARALTARMWDLAPEEVGICSTSSEAYNLLALALRLREGDEVVINDLDFPAGSTPWLQETCPATVRLWQSRSGALRAGDLIPLLGPRTRLVSTSLVSFYNGFMIDLPAVSEAVRRHSPALVALDVTQAFGRIPLDLSGADVVIGSTHKWILASHGGGLVGVRRERAEELTVPAGGWFNLRDAFGPGRFRQAVPKPGAAGFTVGMPNFPSIYAVCAGLEYIEKTGVERIDQAARPLTLSCLERLRKLSVELITPPEEDALAGILAFRHPDFEEINRRLRAADAFATRVSDRRGAPLQVHVRNGQDFGGRIDKHRDVPLLGHLGDRLGSQRTFIAGTAENVDHRRTLGKRGFQLRPLFYFDDLDAHHANRMVVNIARIRRDDYFILQPGQVRKLLHPLRVESGDTGGGEVGDGRATARGYNSPWRLGQISQPLADAIHQLVHMNEMP